MNETASLDPCKQLYKLSGWEDVELCYWVREDNHPQLHSNFHSIVQQAYHDGGKVTPAYSLGYLLRKLPKQIKQFELILTWDFTRNLWVAGYIDSPNWWTNVMNKNPENAVCELAIELFKQKRLTKGTI